MGEVGRGGGSGVRRGDLSDGRPVTAGSLDRRRDDDGCAGDGLTQPDPQQQRQARQEAKAATLGVTLENDLRLYVVHFNSCMRFPNIVGYPCLPYYLFSLRA